MYDEYRTVDSALRNQLCAVFGDPYFYTLNNGYTGYVISSTMDLITHIYQKYFRVSLSDMATNNERIQASYNSEEPLERLI